jgi:hypothetical protein
LDGKPIIEESVPEYTACPLAVIDNPMLVAANNNPIANVRMPVSTRNRFLWPAHFATNNVLV